MSAFCKWVLGAGVFNLVAAFPLAMPFSYRGYLALLDALNTSLGWDGRALTPPEDAFGMLAVNTAGLALALVGAMLIYTAANLEARAGIPLMNAIARLIFTGLVVYYVLIADLARVILIIALIDAVIAAAFLILYSEQEKQCNSIKIKPVSCWLNFKNNGPKKGCSTG